MSALQIVLGVLFIILSVLLIIIVLMQQSRQANLSGAIQGGADSFLGKNKARGIDARLARITKYFGIAFFVLALAAMYLLAYIV
ncbi:MAG: preprotein translocase subunit SecG [Clostridia bacterium]